MFGKGSKLYSAFNFKCPKCHEGNLFKSSLFSMEGIYNMHEDCPSCGQKFEIEPGFYWGAMYIGYALSSGYMLSGMTASILLLGLTVNQSFALVIFLGVLIVPLIARMARSIWINIYIHYDKNAIGRKNIKS